MVLSGTQTNPLSTAISTTHHVWLSHDPIGEQGGVNLLGFVDNTPGNRSDLLGLSKRVSVDAKACTITVTLNITIYARNKKEAKKIDLPGVAQSIGNSVESYWNGYSFGCCEVHVDATVTADMTSTTFWGAHGDNEIQITSDSKYRSNVNVFDNGGTWSSTDPDAYWVYSHEAGHLMGLPDDYHDKDDHSEPDEGHEGHMMAEVGGVVAQHEIDNMLKGYTCPCDK